MNENFSSHIKSIIFYISTGGNNIMYTLRRITVLKDGRESDSYVKNLSTESDKAIIHATEYYSKFESVIKGVFPVLLDDQIKTNPLLEWGDGKLTASDMYKIKSLLNGVILFGKHHGKRIQDIPNDYLCWVCGSCKKNSLDGKQNKVSELFANIALAELIDRGFIKTYHQLENYLSEVKEKKHKLEMLSDHIGEVKERIELTELTIVYCKYEWDHIYNQKRYFFKLKQDNNVLTYSGTIDLGDEKSKINIKATIKDHKLYNEIKTTVISRPIVL